MKAQLFPAWSAGFAAILCAMAPAAAAGPSAAEIVQQAFTRDSRNDEIARQYTFFEREIERNFDSDGSVRSTDSKTYDITVLDGSLYRRLIRENGQPLSAEDERKEQEKLFKSIEKMRNESASDREKRRKQAGEREERQAKMKREITRAFQFRLAGEETIGGRKAWIIDAEPRKDYQPASRRNEFLKKIRARLWIAETDYAWLKVEAETIEKASFGWFLLRLDKGARIELTQQFVNNEVWMLDTFRLRFQARLGLIKGLNREVAREYSNFRKFQVDSKVLAVSTVD